ncbi:M66 family metalloprotease [Pseudomonas sp. 148P]|uniref:M66 family metalloprotease n=1 Tax=Pseudomonas ulcerans TaxID=3115852 RepID=A0ABU7HZI0_9PSED|nr:MULTISPECIES: M66 family metalloprotease [unclassified Pseudomonas]MEE1925014.1 M66 family metalloprotease [Pseudomonas sp. 147P]MEE1936957.1 M66 family metalloprotease [Pseudomonas sp. 148P]
MSENRSILYFNERVLNNDLVGELRGSVLFAQSSIPSSRQTPVHGDRQPRLVGQRTTLVMFKPISDIRRSDGIELRYGDFVIQMSPPEALPPVTERDSDPEYARIVYAENVWSTIVPWQYIVPRVDLEFSSGDLEGTYSCPDMSAPGELLLNTIDIGMLTPNRREFIDVFTPERQRQYFQTLPCSRLIVNQYEPVHFQFIGLADGTRYMDHSAMKGDWHNGDLRQRIGKELISLGINNASLGIHSSPGSGEDGLNKHTVVAQLTAHSSVGNYSNGRVVHGGSGGGTMVTLEHCVGNEFSHELGHNYGLSHHPGGFDGSVHRAAAGTNSTWGWDSDKNVFIPNFSKERTGNEVCEGGICEPPFHGHEFGRDAMSSGHTFYPQTNGYTPYTPWTLKAAQQFLENNAIFSQSSSTGYRKWDESEWAMVEWGELYRAGPDELDLASMTDLLKRYKRVEVDLGDDHWAEHVYLPAAGTAGNGKGVRIVHNASADTVLYLGSTPVTLKKGDMLKYEVQGNWAKVDEFSVNVAGTPEQVGVPVTTLLGYYDPDQDGGGVIYPALHCAYGVTHPGTRETDAMRERSYAVVFNGRSERLYFVLAGERLNEGEGNRFHFNIPQSFEPILVEIYCNGRQNAQRGIDPPKGTARVTFSGRD